MFTKADIEKYFVAEKQLGLLFVIIGIAGIITAVIFFILLKHPFYRGASVPLFFIGLLVLFAGYTVFKRSDDDRKRLVYAYDMNPGEIKEKEIPRMKKVMKNFSLYRYIQVLLMVIGVSLYIYFLRDIRHDFWRGLGLALAVMALITFVADFIAARRAGSYYEGMKTWSARV